MKMIGYTLGFFLLVLPTAYAADSALSRALLLSASFDQGLDADYAAGDKRLYNSASGNRSQAMPGLPEGDLVVVEKGTGKFGDALRFTKKMRPVVFFKGEKNLGYNTNSWSGSCSLWLKLDPDKDLQPGYCDPLQFVAQGWDEGNMFIEFSKDHTPRHFRYAILSVKKHWNPANRGWEEIPEKERPMVPVHKPPFTSEKWTHVLFTFSNINSGQKNSIGQLYLDGELQGSFGDREHVFNWDVSKSAITLGLSYIGMMDDLAIFNRELNAQEVKQIYGASKSVSELLKK